MEVLTEAEATYRVIDLNTCDVWCPLHGEHVCVCDGCLGGLADFSDLCRHYNRVHFMGRVICTWPEDARRDAVDLPTYPLV